MVANDKNKKEDKDQDESKTKNSKSDRAANQASVNNGMMAKVKGVDPSVVGAGLVGAAAGAVVAIALTNEESRKKMMKLADDARTTLQKVMDTLEKTGIDVKKNVQGVTDQVKEKVTAQAQKVISESIAGDATQKSASKK